MVQGTVLNGTKGIGVPSKSEGNGQSTIDIHLDSGATLVSWNASTGPTDPGSLAPNQKFSIRLEAGDYRLMIDYAAPPPSDFPLHPKNRPGSQSAHLG